MPTVIAPMPPGGYPVRTSAATGLVPDDASLEAASNPASEAEAESEAAAVLPVDLASEVTGNLPIANLAGGTGASSSTFLRGDNTWAEPEEPVTGFSAVILADSPLHYWALNEEPVASTSFAALAGGVAMSAGATTAQPIAGAAGRTGRSVMFAGTDFLQSASEIDLTAYGKVIVECLLWWDDYATDDRIALEFGPSLTAGQGWHLIPGSSVSGGTFAPSLKGDVGYSIASYTRPTLAAWRHLVMVFAMPLPTDEVNLYIDGALATPTARFINSNNTNTFGDSILYVMARAGASFFGSGRIQHLAIYGDTTDPAQIAAHFTALPPASAVSYGIVWDGDSLNTDYNRSGTATLPQLIAALFPNATVSSFAVNGQRVDEATADAVAQIDALYAGLSDYDYRICGLLAGVNDLDQSADAATTFGRIEAYHDARQAEGWLTVCCTIPKANISAGAETERDATNVLLRADHSFADVFVDLDLLFGEDNTLPNFFDGTHLSVIGAQVAAAEIHKQILAQLPPA